MSDREKAKRNIEYLAMIDKSIDKHKQGKTIIETMAELEEVSRGLSSFDTLAATQEVQKMKCNPRQYEGVDNVEAFFENLNSDYEKENSTD